MHDSDKTSPAGVGFVNGEVVPISEAGVSITELESLRSAAVFDVAHVWNHRFFRLDDHLRRFMNAITQRHMAIDLNRDQIRGILHDCVRASAHGSAPQSDDPTVKNRHWLDLMRRHAGRHYADQVHKRAFGWGWLGCEDAALEKYVLGRSPGS